MRWKREFPNRLPWFAMRGKKIWVLVSFSIGISLSFLAHWRTDGFQVSKIIRPSNFSYPSLCLAISKETEQMSNIFSQSFVYIGHGRQTYVFESADKKYVLKCLNHSRFSFPSIFWKFPLPSFLEKRRHLFQEKKNRRLQYFFEGYSLAYERIKEQCRIKWLGFSPNPPFEGDIMLINKCGVRSCVPLRKMTFVLQEKIFAFTDFLHRLEQIKQIEELEEMIDSYLSAIFMRCRCGIGDGDGRCLENMGIREGRFIIFDCGRMFNNSLLHERAVLEKEVLRSTSRLRKWMEERFPKNLNRFDEKIQKALDREMMQKPF